MCKCCYAPCKLQVALEGAHRAAEEVLQTAEERAAAAARELTAARDAAQQRLSDTEAELRCALQVRPPAGHHFLRFRVRI